MNRCAVTTLLAVAAILPVAPIASAEIVLTDASSTTATAPGATATTPGTAAPSPGTGVPGEKDDPNNPIESDVELGSSAFKLGGALGSATTGSSGQKGLCTVLGTASSLGGLAALGCGNLNGGGGIGPGTIK
ncbi:hypothetical protein [Nocardia sp. CDC160]|uniref:hypothetical protein n=1 Tax=Nocardia sp. CDC160 TaxID=3112166 RepID=UPI002DBE8AAD|nr:hypothetical protein [Nocardia sp. CDC160]MEC3915673.1 hypothetical protein [Nocardia sp. CDC160]